MTATPDGISSTSTIPGTAFDFFALKLFSFPEHGRACDEGREHARDAHVQAEKGAAVRFLRGVRAGASAFR